MIVRPSLSAETTEDILSSISRHVLDSTRRGMPRLLQPVQAWARRIATTPCGSPGTEINFHAFRPPTQSPTSFRPAASSPLTEPSKLEKIGSGQPGTPITCRQSSKASRHRRAAIPAKRGSRQRVTKESCQAGMYCVMPYGCGATLVPAWDFGIWHVLMTPGLGESWDR